MNYSEKFVEGRLLYPICVSIAQLEYAAYESILCATGGDAALPKLLWDFFLSGHRAIIGGQPFQQGNTAQFKMAAKMAIALSTLKTHRLFPIT